MKLLKKLVTAAIAGCMALSLSACSDTTWVYEFDGEKIPSGLYIGYTISAYSQVSQQEGYDANIKDIFKQTINGKSTYQWIKDTAKQECAMYAVYEKKFNELGLSFSEDDISALDSSLKSNWDSLGTVYEKNGVSKASYRKLLESSKRESMIFSKYYGEGGLEEVKKEDLLAHFKENFASVNIFRMALYTGSDLTDEQKKSNEKTKTDSEKYLKMLN